MIRIFFELDISAPGSDISSVYAASSSNYYDAIYYGAYKLTCSTQSMSGTSMVRLINSLIYIRFNVSFYLF